MASGIVYRFCLLILVLLFASASVSAQTPVAAEPQKVLTPAQSPQAAINTGSQDHKVSGATTDSTLDTAPKSRTDSVIVVKHSFDHREQIITGSVIMSCLMLMMVAMNNYNPR